MSKKRMSHISLILMFLIIQSGITFFLIDHELKNVGAVNNTNNFEIRTSIVLNAVDFSFYSSDDYVDAVVLFKENIDVKLLNLIPDHWYSNLNGFSGKIPQTMFNYLESAFFVSSICTNSQGEFCQDDLTWGVGAIDAEIVWGGEDEATDVLPGYTAGEGITIGIIDSGVEFTHEDLDEQFRGSDDLGDSYDDDGNGYIDDYYGWNFLDNNNDVSDIYGHGTMVAGILVAEDNGKGVIGVAPKANIVMAKISNSATFELAKAIAGIDYCIACNVDIISMSWIERNDDITLLEACQRAYNAGIVLVGGSGNDNINQVYAPAKYNIVIAVGALMEDDFGNLFRWESLLGAGSNYGNDLDLVAPGAQIWTTYLSNSYYHDSGTSFACPMVSGVVALMLSAKPNLTPTQIKSKLISTAIKLNTYTFDGNGFNIEVGYGCVNADAAVERDIPVDSKLPFIEDGTGVYDWTEIDNPYAKLQTNVNYDGKTCMFNYEDISHYQHWQVAESQPIDLSNWDGISNLLLSFQFRCQSNWAGSSVTQFRLIIYDRITHSIIPYTNPTSSSYYYVSQNNRNGQTWLSGKDSGWQAESFIIPAGDLDQFAGTNNLVLRWGHYDSWSYDWYQREYLDYIKLEDVGPPPEPIPNSPRDLLGLGDGISQITLTWKSPLNVLATEYKIYKKIGSSFIHIDTVDHVGGINDVQLKNYGGHSPGITYYYRVSAVNADGIEGPYAQWSGTVGGFGLKNPPDNLMQNFNLNTKLPKIFLLGIFCLNIIGLIAIYFHKLE